MTISAHLVKLCITSVMTVVVTCVSSGQQATPKAQTEWGVRGGSAASAIVDLIGQGVPVRRLCVIRTATRKEWSVELEDVGLRADEVSNDLIGACKSLVRDVAPRRDGFESGPEVFIEKGQEVTIVGFRPDVPSQTRLPSGVRLVNAYGRTIDVIVTGDRRHGDKTTLMDKDAHFVTLDPGKYELTVAPRDNVGRKRIALVVEGNMQREIRITKQIAAPSFRAGDAPPVQPKGLFARFRKRNLGQIDDGPVESVLISESPLAKYSVVNTATPIVFESRLPSVQPCQCAICEGKGRELVFHWRIAGLPDGKYYARTVVADWDGKPHLTGFAAVDGQGKEDDLVGPSGQVGWGNWVEVRNRNSEWQVHRCHVDGPFLSHATARGTLYYQIQMLGDRSEFRSNAAYAWCHSQRLLLIDQW